MNAADRFLARQSFSGIFAGETKSRIFRQLQRLIRSGVTVPAALDMLHHLYSKNGKKPSEPLAKMILEWRNRLASGKSLAQSMSGWISTSEEMIIDAGEQSERLAQSLGDALRASGSAKRIRNTIISGMIYPLFLLLLLCGMLYGFSTQMVPTFAEILSPTEWTGTAATMYSVSTFVEQWLATILVGLSAGIVVVVATMPYVTGPVRPYLDRLPPWSIFKIAQGASFMISLQGFLAAGLPVPDALRKMSRIANPYLRERVNILYASINMGRNLGEAMIESRNDFPDNAIAGEISIYAGLPDFVSSLDILATEWIDGAVARTAAAAKAINTVMLVAIAGTVGFIVLGMFELQNLITSAVQR